MDTIRELRLCLTFFASSLAMLSMLASLIELDLLVDIMESHSLHSQLRRDGLRASFG